MRENYGAHWAFGVRGAIENIVREALPTQLQAWPLLRAFDFEAYDLSGTHACVILRDKLSGIPTGPGLLSPFPHDDHPSLPRSGEDASEWQNYLNGKFALRPGDAAVVFPIYDSGKGAPADYDMFSDEEQDLWDKQLRHIVIRYAAWLEMKRPSQSPSQHQPPSQPVHITYNVSGQGRVNIGSLDTSRTTVNQSSSTVFADLRNAASSVPDASRHAEIMAAIQGMEMSRGTGEFPVKYKEFMGVVADHITIFAPMLPALALLL